MATTAADQGTKGEAATERAYAAAAGETAVNKPVAAAAPAQAPAKQAEAPAKPVPAKIDSAVAEVKAAPKKAPVAKKNTARKPAAKKVAAKKARIVKAKPASQQVAKGKAKATPKAAKARLAAPKLSIPTVSQLKDKIMATTKTTDFTKTAKDAAADVQTRAKAAYDKLQAYAGEMTEFTKGNVEAIVELGKILGAGVQELARGEVAAAKGAFETVTADVKAMVAVKSPTELFKLQGEIARRNFDAAVARASKNAEVSMKLANDAFAPISSRMSLAAEKVSKAA